MRSEGARLLEKLPLFVDRPAVAYGCTLLLCAIAFTLRYILLTALPIGYPYVSFIPAIILATFLFGRGPGILAAVLGGLWAWYFFTPPFASFKLNTDMILPFGFYILIVTVDIKLVGWMQTASHQLVEERERSRLLAERSEVLFRELQHRISNNLQVVGGLLTLQKRDVTDEKALAALDEAARRLHLIGRIHRQLHDPSGEQLQVGPFLWQLTADIIDTSGRPGISYTVDADEGIILGADDAILVALIVAESISNAIEHGFGDRSWGKIAIQVHRKDDTIDLTVKDDGRGLPEGFELASSKSLGLRLSQMLATQLGGQFTLLHSSGATAMLRIPRR